VVHRDKTELEEEKNSGSTYTTIRMETTVTQPVGKPKKIVHVKGNNWT
jgi:hypothetical protein